MQKMPLSCQSPDQVVVDLAGTTVAFFPTCALSRCAKGLLHTDLCFVPLLHAPLC